MPMKLLSSDDFRAAAKDGQRPEGTLFKFATAEPETVGEAASRTKRFVFSDATVDHSDDSIDPKGWNLGIFKRNPVALFSHMSWDPPIGRASNVAVQDNKLVGDIEFATADVYEFADTIYRLVDGGFLKAVSVGFKPDEWAFTNDKNRPYGIDFKKQTLLEISVCPVPCNPNALNEARSIGVDTRPLAEWAEKVLDSGETVFMPRKDVEALRLQAKGVQPVRYYLQASGPHAVDMVQLARDELKRWQADPTDTLVLPAGFTLRAVGADAPPLVETPDAPATDDLPPEVMEAAAADLTNKAGRRVSAATKAKLQEAMDMSAAHHEAMNKCIKDLMDGDGSDDEPDDDENTGAIDPEPPAAIVLETLSPEEQRLKEVRALRETIPTNN